MHPGPEHMGGPGFSSRRPNASSLPAFELPPPPLSSNQKYQYAVSGTQSAQVPGSLASVGNLLTPPSSIGGEGMNTSPGTVNTSSAPSVPGYSNGQFATWTAPNQNNTSYYPAAPNNQNYHASHRVPYSPVHTVRGNPHSPAASESGQISSSYEASLPPFPTSSHTPLSAPSTLPTMAPQQPQHTPHGQQPQHQRQQQTHPSVPSTILTSQAPVSTSGPQPSPVHAQEAFRPPPTPSYYSPMSSATPQHANFAYTTGPSPTHPSPLSAGAPLSARPQISPVSAGPVPPLSAPPLQSPHAYPRPFGPMQQGPVLSNISNPGAQPMIIGGLPHGLMHGFNSGHAASMQQIYGNPPTQQQQNDRPFKCDQCPQSFNRNHDLKRHKRIHLAVKPFPCGHCDKSFSRKDALKRHVLVKGCGKAQAAAEAEKRDTAGSLSPPNETPASLSEATEVKPVVAAH